MWLDTSYVNKHLFQSLIWYVFIYNSLYIYCYKSYACKYNAYTWIYIVQFKISSIIALTRLSWKHTDVNFTMIYDNVFQDEFHPSIFNDCLPN